MRLRQSLGTVCLPCHGSASNVTTEFFAALHADHHVISADGKHDHRGLDMPRARVALLLIEKRCLGYLHDPPAMRFEL
jgi:hypothetical protein